MTTQSYAGTVVNINGEGYLTDASEWTPAVGEAIAGNVGITLNDTHWEVINYARGDYASTGKSPGLRRIAANTSASIKSLYKLFPKGPGKLVARIAGTPKPKSCL
jgi:TusE/DsrC/DsvC family sulfur relay protein